MSEQYTDFFGYHHICQKKISEGGQGAVYRTQSPNIAVKIAKNDQGVIQNESLNSGYNMIRLLPIPQDLHITLPLAVLEGVSGYVMALLDDMSSFESVFLEAETPEDFTTPWLAEMSDTPEFVDELRRYISSGGRRRRIEAFYKCACILARLHGTGLVYCDISGNNLFMSTNKAYSEIWLIDADNINWGAECAQQTGFQTPGYGAPEILKGQGNSCYSDCYSFAILLFQVLYGIHPFEGAGVYDEDGDFQEELRDCGELPWIFDKDDDSNLSESNIPYEYLVSQSLDRLFQQTFSAKGRQYPKRRPNMAEWAWFLGKELDAAVHCPYCGMDYNAMEMEACPWCDTKPAIIKISSFLNEKRTSPFWTIMHEFDLNSSIQVPLRLARGIRTEDKDQTLFCITRVSTEKHWIKLRDFHEDWKFSVLETGEELYTEVVLPDKCCLKCEKDSETIWIEVNFNETERS